MKTLERQPMYFLLLLVFIVSIAGQNLPPVFIDNFQYTRVPENTKIGTSVYTLLAEDPEGGPVTYIIVSDAFSANPQTGVIRVTRNLDYETGEKFLSNIIVKAVDQADLTTTVQITVNVIDRNDNPSVFTQDRYKEKVPETTPVNTIIGNLTVTDLDYSNSQLQVTCNASARTGSVGREDADACATFRINQVSTGNRKWTGTLEVIKPLDFETRPTYQLPLQTFDGVNKKITSFEIQIADVNDSPPTFTYTAPATVNENIPTNSVITYVVAVDGDKANPNQIRYELNCTEGVGLSLFTIDQVTGNITNIRQLDRESRELSLGYVDLCVKARELIVTTPEKLGNDSLTTATATIRISITDINDNKPTFHKSEFTVNIREDIANQTPLPGLIMTVTDKDSGTANSYDFVLLDNIDIFSIFPKNGQGQTTSSIQVINTQKIDYEKGPRQYILRVEARERLPGQISRLTGSATVTVNILDVNDNYPIFTQKDYTKTILETANIGSSVVDITVTDPDSGNYGTQGVIFGLVGNGAERFVINNRTGSVTVANCSPPKPGEYPCIDYEDTKEYELTVTAVDELGVGLSQTARLRISIKDVNDNAPQFILSEYAGSIFEGKVITIDPLIANARDRDTVGGPVRYSILDTGPRSQLWQIDPVTANITAKQPIKYEDTLNSAGVFTLTVYAKDQAFTTPVKVTIYVIDRNDQAPVFTPKIYIETIDEFTKGNYAILTVTAKDKDSPTTDNGKIEYGIETGGVGKFVIDKTSGLLSTSPDATFDYEVQRQYVMQVLARDGGNPQLTGTASVTIHIRDSNNKDPYFKPQTERAEVYENVPIGTSVTTLLGYDRDAGNRLNYRFTDPVTAISPDGIEINPNDYNYKNLFELVETTGRVRTSGKLDRDRTSIITYTMLVIDVSANPRQTGTGTLIIDILEYNDQSPYFQLPLYNITIDEEQPIGAFIMTLIAQDEDDEIAQYEIFDDRGNYFAISSSTGVLTVKNNIDYEKIQKTQFNARATDSGFPPLSNTTKILVNIRNINDNSPIFDKSAYTATVEEHIPLNTQVVTVTAVDRDLEDYGEVRYTLDNAESRFIINSESGVISTNADLDREKQSTISLQVKAYDSPLDSSVRRYFTVPVYITLSDINDNSPVFSANEYETTIIETIDIGAQVLQVFASDRDVGNNAIIAFSVLSGNDQGFFEVGRSSGRITVNLSLRKKAGDYVFFVIAKDLNGDPLARNDTAKVIIHVIEAINSPPIWTIPPRDNLTIEVLESQYLGMLVYDVEAVDTDNGKSGIVDYGFFYKGNYTQRTPEFSINSVTGVIRAEIQYDREAVPRYVLQLSARDRGDPPLEAIRFLSVLILDVNDNVPKFAMSNGQTIPQEFSVEENADVGTQIGRVNATDIDTIDKVYYYILAGDRDTFGISATTGIIYLKKLLNREKIPLFTLEIQATNNISDYTVIRERRRRSTDPSIVTVRITVNDIEDEEPVFTSFNGPDQTKEYYGCISATAPFGKSVVQVQATDADSAGPAGLRFSLGGDNPSNTFAIDESTGLIYNRLLVDKVQQNVFLLKAIAKDRGGLNSTAPVKVFKTTAANEVKIVISQKSSEVLLFIQQLIRLLQEEKDIQYVCVSLVRNHINADGLVDKTQTDVYLTAANGAGSNYRMYTTQELIGIIQAGQQNNRNSYDALYITGVGTKVEQRSFIEETAVLAVLIIIILLIIMALILFCLACYCINDSKKKKLRRTEAERFTVISQEPVKTMSPVYDNQGFERDPMPLPEPEPVPVQHQPSDEYAVVQKKRPLSDEFVMTQVIPVQSALPEEPDRGPMPIIETTVVEDDVPPYHSVPTQPEPFIVTEIVEDPQPQAVYIPDPEPQAVYIPDPEPQAVYIPDPEPQAVYIPDPEPELIRIPDPEPPHLEYIPEPVREPEEGVEEMIVEIQDDTPQSTPRHSPPPSPKYSPPASPTSQQSPSLSPRYSPTTIRKEYDDGDQLTTDVM